MRKIGRKYYKKIIHIEEKPPKATSERIKEVLDDVFPKQIFSKSFSIFLCACFAVLFLVGGFFIFIKTHEDFAANFADNTLRPLIGEQGTIQIEAFFFAIQDNVNQVKYKTFHQTAQNTVAYAQSKTISASIGAAVSPKFPLDPIKPLIGDNSIPGEGVWTPIVVASDSPLIAKTTYRPDSDRPYAVATLAKLNMSLSRLNIVAGLQQPGGIYKPGPGKIPVDIQASNTLLAAFNGGFQQKDGYYGMIVGNTTYLPLEQNMATLVMYQNETPKIVRYTGQNLGNNVIAIRQNGPMLIENGQIVTSSNVWNMQTWGLTTTNSMYTWRSGVGVDKDGNLIYVSGPSLVPETLANSLQAAGAVNAMQLDINTTWVRFSIFNPLGNGQYNPLTLNPSMVNGGYQYLHGYQKDFFYVYRK
ncbi:MAG: phosphodiester glycosidase family protein [Candidatus Levyibacteriota bacterium]